MLIQTKNHVNRICKKVTTVKINNYLYQNYIIYENLLETSMKIFRKYPPNKRSVRRLMSCMYEYVIKVAA